VDYNSEKNIDIKRAFLKQEVFYQFTKELNSILAAGKNLHGISAGLPCWQEVKNLQGKTDRSKIEWFIVSEYLHGELGLKGEIVLQWGESHFWGRTNNHVKMERDPVISEVCEEMQILEGQEYEGAVKM
jgi:hypothetical protein